MRTQYPPLNATGPARLIVLISGGGSNMAALHQACLDPAYGAQIVAVGSDRPDIAGLAYAGEHGLETFTCALPDYPDRESWDRGLCGQVASYQPDLVICAGFLKLLGPTFLDQFGGRTLNTHNSLLPAFPGVRGPQDAVEYGVKVAGATLFIVDAGVDTGVIVAQCVVPVDFDDDADSLLERIKVAERAQLVDIVGQMCRQGWEIDGRRARIRPA